MKAEKHYKFPERIFSARLMAFRDTSSDYTLTQYLQRHGFALSADLLLQGFKKSEVENAVRLGKIGVAHWPALDTVTDLYWSKDEETLKTLEGLAQSAVQLCYGQSETQAVGGNFLTVGGKLESQQLAIVALIYAREQGKLREILSPELIEAAGNSFGPLYVVINSWADKEYFAPNARFFRKRQRSQNNQGKKRK